MALRLYDSYSRTFREFIPLRPPQVGIYLCGATVQAPPHIGHIRSGVNFDVLHRWLLTTGHQVTFVRNVTDIDDKILQKATAAQEPWWALAARNERAFAQAYATLGCLPPTVEPRATGHIPQMIALIERLLERGHAYPAAGDVYFDVSSFPEYGQLSRQDPEQMQHNPDVGPKRSPHDFALWKSAKPDEPAWSAPWGPGRPGWHIECSAMAHTYLGASFDIHGGGLDLTFPHHENEIAQSRAAGYDFAQYWMHNAWVTTAGEKMSKSLGNSLLVSAVTQRFRPAALRYYLIATHYRSMLEYSEGALQDAATAFERISRFVLQHTTEPIQNLAQEWNAAANSPQLQAFQAALDDDLATPTAIAVIHETVKFGNLAQSAGETATATERAREAQLMLAVLGLDPRDPHWQSGDSTLTATLDGLIEIIVSARNQARERKDYAQSDQIRDQLLRLGVQLADTATGTTWTIEPR